MVSWLITEPRPSLCHPHPHPHPLSFSLATLKRAYCCCHFSTNAINDPPDWPLFCCSLPSFFSSFAALLQNLCISHVALTGKISHCTIFFCFLPATLRHTQTHLGRLFCPADRNITASAGCSFFLLRFLHWRSLMAVDRECRPSCDQV